MSAEKETQTQTGIRLPDSLLERIDKIALRLSKPGMQVTRAVALRRIIFLGADQIEAELKKR